MKSTWIYLLGGWAVIAVIAVIYNKYKKHVARKIEGDYASVEAARAVLRFNRFAPDLPGSKEIWHDRKSNPWARCNELLVLERPDGTASVSKYE